MSSGAVLLSVVVPTVNERQALPALLDDLRPLREAIPSLELVVADGGSTDATPDLAAAVGATIVRSARGRGLQLRAAVEASRGRWLWALHADVRVPPPTLARITDLVREDGGDCAWACQLHIDAPGWTYRLIERGANLRSARLGLPYGDQGLLIPRALLDAVGGYDAIPLMEDVVLARRLQRRGAIRLLDAALHVSARRWERDGPWRRSFRNLWLLGRFLAGADPQTLVRAYERSR